MLGIREMLDAFATGDLSPVEVLPSGDDPHGAWAAWCLDRAMEEARAAERAWRRGEPTGPLCGVPFAAKDMLDSAGVPTECGSSILRGRVPGHDAAAVAALRRAGAVLVGKTSTVEFAWGLMMRTARNPHDPSRTPGGSSGGSAIAVATGSVPLALGTDTGGSIRLPAAFCGVVGFKPNYAAVPAAGCWPLARTMDCVGPIARTVEDAALAFGVLAEPWELRAAPGDLAPRPEPLPSPAERIRAAAASEGPAAAARMGVEGLRVGVAADLGMALAAEVAAAVERMAARLQVGGADIVTVELPDAQEVMDAYMPGFLAEALWAHISAGLWPGRREEYGEPVRRRLELAEAQPVDAVVAGTEAMTRVHAAYRRVWTEIDLLLTPVCASGPPRLDDPAADLRAAASPLVCVQNLLGVPACAIPAGMDGDGLPIGVQMSGPSGQDDRVLAGAAAALA